MTPADLRAWRLERGLTQAALGALLGLAVQQRRCLTIARYESGESPIPRVVELALVAIDSANEPGISPATEATLARTPRRPTDAQKRRQRATRSSQLA